MTRTPIKCLQIMQTSNRGDQTRTSRISAGYYNLPRDLGRQKCIANVQLCDLNMWSILFNDL